MINKILNEGYVTLIFLCIEDMAYYLGSNTMSWWREICIYLLYTSIPNTLIFDISNYFF